MRRITVECSRCDSAKLPLRACECCGAEGGPDEIATWRERLHAHASAVILAAPRRHAEPLPVMLPRPLRVVIDLRGLVGATETLIVPDTVAPPPNPLSFDWDDRRGLRRLRRSA